MRLPKESANWLIHRLDMTLTVVTGQKKNIVLRNAESGIFLRLFMLLYA